jgi:dolichol-phosphate mannosyltransferase
LSPSLTIATPCYNEALSLPTYFERIQIVRSTLEQGGWRVALTLIDDGSKDDTATQLKRYAESHRDTTFISHPGNLGYGAAIKTALCTSDTDWMVFVDADTNYDQRIILEMVRKFDGPYDLVNVSIFAPGSAAGYPWYRLILSATATRIYRILLPRLTKGIYTMTCGFRAYRRGLAEKILPLADDFVATAEIMLRALKNGVRVLEFPASNARREQGVSKMKFIRVSWGHLCLSTRALSGRLQPPPSRQDHLDRIQGRQA